MKCLLDIRGELNFRFNLGWCGSVGSKSLSLPLAHRCSLARALAEFSSSGPGGVKGGLQPQLFIRLASWQQKFLARLKCHFHGCWHTWVGLRFPASGLFFPPLTLSVLPISGFYFLAPFWRNFMNFLINSKGERRQKFTCPKWQVVTTTSQSIYLCVCVGQLLARFGPLPSVTPPLHRIAVSICHWSCRCSCR